jgi:RNA polymerase sigma-70 factor, ECF subfamily
MTDSRFAQPAGLHTRLLLIGLADGEPMSFLSRVQLEDKFGPFVTFQEALGFIPNLLHAQTLLPRVVEAQVKLETAVRLQGGAISRLQKERILLRVAADRQDAYCVGVDSKVLSSLGVPDSQVDDLLNHDRPSDLSAADLASLQFCLKLSRYAPSVCWEDVEALRAWGLGDESIFEAVVVTALAVYRCTLSVGLGPEPDFGSRRIASGRIDPPPEVAPHGFFPDAHAAQKKGPYVSAPYLSPKTFAPFATLQKSHGFIPNFFRAQTLRPDLLEAEAVAVDRILLPEDVLTRVQKECILLVVSAANLNSYCVAMHCNLLRGLGMAPEEGDQIAVDHHQSSLSEADRALLDFALKLGTRFSEFSREDVDKLQTLGFSEEQILECEVVTALNNFANTLQVGLGIEPDFEPPPAFRENKVHLPAVDGRLTTDGCVVHTPATVQDPDAGLVAQAQAGKLEAFEELVRRHSQLIYRTLTAMLGNPADAQDAMQDALLSAFKHIGGFQGRSKFSTWLVSIARNTALQLLRGRKDVESLDEGEHEEDRDFRPRQVRAWEDDPEQCYSNSEIRQLVEKGILGLPAKYRVVVMLRDIEQLSTEEVARQLGLSVPAVKVRLLRGRLMLREWLSPQFTASLRRAAQ